MSKKEHKTYSKIWKVMRGLRKFTVPELMEISGLSQRIVYRYVILLCKSGYLKKTGTDKVYSRGKARDVYRIVKDTGPKAPHLTVSMYDPNTGEYMGVEDVD